MMNLRVVALTLSVWSLGCLDVLAQDSPWGLPTLRRIRFDFFGHGIPGMWELYLGIALCLFIAIHGLRAFPNIPQSRGSARSPQTPQGAPLTLLSLWAWVGASYGLVAWRLHAPPLSTWMVLVGCSLLGLIGALVAMRLAVRALESQEPSSSDPTSLNIRCRPSSSRRTLRLVLNAGEYACLLALIAGLPPEHVGDGLIGFLFGQSLGTCIVLADADARKSSDPECVRESLRSFREFGLLGVPLLLALARLLDHSPALSASILLWVIAMKLVILFVSFIGSLLETPDCSPANTQDGTAVSRSTSGPASLWGMTAGCAGLIFIASYFILGDSRTFPSLWRTLALWASGGILIRSTLAHSSPGSRLKPGNAFGLKAAIVVILAVATAGLTRNEPFLQSLQGGGWMMSILACAVSACVLGELRPGDVRPSIPFSDQSQDKQVDGLMLAGMLLVLTCLQLTLRRQQAGATFSWAPHFPAIGLGVLIGSYLAYGLCRRSARNDPRSRQEPDDVRLPLILLFYLILGLSLIQPYTAAACLVGMALSGVLIERLSHSRPRTASALSGVQCLLPYAGITALLALNIVATAHSPRACHLAGATLIGLSLLLRYFHRHGLTRTVT